MLSHEEIYLNICRNVRGVLPFVIHCICIHYIYLYIVVLFGPVKPELGVIPSGQGNRSKVEHLNFPGRELNVINITEQYFL